MSLTKQPHIKKPLPSDTPFKTAYGEKLRVALSFPENSRWTKQSFKDECDINNVMQRYQSTGEMPVMNQQAPEYLDATGFDYQDAMQFVAGANSLFQELPSAVRNRFGNDPRAFLDFTSNPNNREEMAQMGLLSDRATLVDLPPPTGEKERPQAVSSAPPIPSTSGS